MEEKKKIKVSLSAIVIFILIAIIIGMGFYIYKLNKDKYYMNVGASQPIEELNEKIDELEEENFIENNNISITFSENQIKELIQKYLNLKGAYDSSPEDFLFELGFENFEKEYEENSYIKTNIKYSEYKNKMLNYMTEYWFERFFQFNEFENVNGNLYYRADGGTGQELEVEEIQSKDNDRLLNNYIAKVYDVTFEEVYNKQMLEDIEFYIEEQNGKCVIAYCGF